MPAKAAAASRVRPRVAVSPWRRRRGVSARDSVCVATDIANRGHDVGFSHADGREGGGPRSGNQSSTHQPFILNPDSARASGTYLTEPVRAYRPSAWEKPTSCPRL